VIFDSITKYTIVENPHPPQGGVPLFFERGFARLGSVLQFFLDHRKYQKISNYLKKSQNISNLLEKTKNKKKTREHQIKLTQPYNNFAEASGRIAAQLSAVIIFPRVVKC